MFESPVLKRCSTKPTTSFCKEQTILSFIFFSSPAAGVDPASTFPPSPRLRPFQPRFLVLPCKMISTLCERVEIPKVEDSPRHKYKYTNTNTQIQIHKYNNVGKPFSPLHPHRRGHFVQLSRSRFAAKMMITQTQTQSQT